MTQWTTASAGKSANKCKVALRCLQTSIFIQPHVLYSSPASATPSGMEDELRCPHCKSLFDNPVLLPCFHALCFPCSELLTIRTSTTGSSSAASSTSSATGDSVNSDHEHLDKVSISSEADSGVVADRCPRPGSFTGTPSCQLPAAPPSVSSLSCPVCRKLCLFDESGAANLPRYRLIQYIIERRRISLSDGPRCEMCDTDPRPAAVVCEQCSVHYCEGCRELCHPARGPLAKHSLVKPKTTAVVPSREPVLCPDHAVQLQFFCGTCKVPACQLCINVNRHGTHDVQPITGVCKAQKVSK